MYAYREDKPTAHLRLNTYGNPITVSPPVLQQMWACREGEKRWDEWRDVPTVCEAPGVKTPATDITYD